MKNELHWTSTNDNIIYVHKLYGVTFVPNENYLLRELTCSWNTVYKVCSATIGEQRKIVCMWNVLQMTFHKRF